MGGYVAASKIYSAGYRDRSRIFGPFSGIFGHFDPSPAPVADSNPFIGIFFIMKNLFLEFFFSIEGKKFNIFYAEKNLTKKKNWVPFFFLWWRCMGSKARATPCQTAHHMQHGNKPKQGTEAEPIDSMLRLFAKLNVPWQWYPLGAITRSPMNTSLMTTRNILAG